MFADRYLQKSTFSGPLLSGLPHPDTSLLVVIPCFDEPEILRTLESLMACTPPRGRVEVIVLINEPEGCAPAVSAFNRQTSLDIQAWASQHSGSAICFFAAGPVQLPRKWAGAGLARKRGMDEAVYRFNAVGKPDGVIVSLDADTLVQPNYLVEIENHFLQNPAHVGATLAFEHQKEGLKPHHRAGISMYEKYLHYYKNAVSYTGYPYSMFTIGSAFAVTAEAYVRRGGMNRRQAGEDFYFLQHLALLGKIGEINSTCVYPSARISERVPFGTGPVLKKWMEGREDLQFTFNLQAFDDLKILFGLREKFYRLKPELLSAVMAQLPLPVAEFLQAEDLPAQFGQLSRNCGSAEVFSNRFFQIFNGLVILKFIHFSHPRHYPKMLLESEIDRLKELMQ